MAEMILPEIFARTLSLDTPDISSPVGKDPFALWERMADDLDEIAANTRGGAIRSQQIVAAAPRTEKERASVQDKVHRLARQRQPISIPLSYSRAAIAGRKVEPASKAGPEDLSEKRNRDRRRTESSATGLKNQKEASASETKAQADSREQTQTRAQQRQARVSAQSAAPSGRSSSRTVQQAVSVRAQAQEIVPGQKADTGEKASDKAPTAQAKSAQAVQAIKAQKAEEKRQKGFFDRLKDAFQDAADKRYRGENQAEETVGLAIGGPFYVALKELKQMGEDAFGKDSFLGRARESFSKNKEKSSVGATREEAKERTRDYKLRDAQGRFIKRADRATVNRDKQKIEIAEESLVLGYDEAREEDKRHKELVRAVKSLKPGLLDRLLGGRGGRGGRAGRAGKDGKDARNLPDAPDRKDKQKKDQGHKDQRPDLPDTPDLPDKKHADSREARKSRETLDTRESRPRRRRGLLGKLGIGASLAVGAGVAASTIAEDGSDRQKRAGQEVVEAASAKGVEKGVEKVVPQAAGKGTTVAASRAGLGAVALKGGASLLRVLGPAAALLMAGLDAKEGFDDKEMQAEAFGLKEGESATTGQKVAAAAANVLDMGGLVSGAAGLLGFDLNTADMARGLYETVSAVGNFFGQFSVGGMLDTAKSAMATATAMGTQALNNIGDFVTSLDLPGKAQAVVSAVGDLGSRAISSVSDFFKTGISNVGDFLSSMNLGEKVQGLVSAVGDIGSKAFSAVTDFLSGIEVPDTLKDVATTAAEAATSIGSKLWDGFTSLFGPDEAHADELTPEMKDKLAKGEVPVPASTPQSAATPNPAPAPTQTPAVKATPAPVSVPAPKPEEPAAVEQPKTEVPAQKAVPSPAPKPATVPPALQPAATQADGKAPVIDSATGGMLAVLAPTDRTALLAPLGTTKDISTELSEQMLALQKSIEADTDLREKEYQLKLLDPNTRALLGLPQDLRSALSGLGGFGGGGGGYTGATTAVSFDPNAMLGDATARWESGNAGVNTVAWDSTGGTSYGKWQLSAKRGSMQEYLQWMLKQGGEKAAIAQRILAAGPIETGGKTGAAVDAYKREAAANGQLLEDTQREFLFQNHYVPALNKLSPDLQKRIGDSKALQEALWSTAIQHGAGGAGSIWRKVFAANPNASNEELLRAIYEYRGTQFGSSTADVQASVKRRFAAESAMLIGMDKAETNYKHMRAAAANGGAEALAAQTSYSLMAATQDAIKRGVTYKWSGKDSRLGGVDCSGWVSEISRGLMQQINTAAGEQVFTAEDFKAVKGSAAGIIQNVSQATGELITGEGLNPENVREGMVIGMDTGAHGERDAGRYMGIDHIVQVYRDPNTGEMMVTESRGDKGVMTSKYTDWYAREQRKGTRLYGADITKLGDASKIRPAEKAEEARAQPQTETVPAETTSTTPPEQAGQVQAATAAPQPEAQSVAAQNVQQAEAQPRPVPEQVTQYAPPQESGTNRQLDMSTVESLLRDILKTLQQGMTKAQTPNNANTRHTPDIPMDFDDPSAQSMANA